MFRSRFNQYSAARFLLVLFLSLPVTLLAEEVSKDRWTEAMQRDLPTTFCKSMEFFQKCFDINEEQCIQAASLASRICLHNYITRIPEVLRQPNDGAKWSNIVGQCVGENFYDTMRRKYKNTKECDQMNLWN